MKTILCWCFVVISGLTYANETGKVSAIIEVWDTHMNVPSEDKLIITEFIRVKIMEEDGYIHGVFRNYYDSFRKITGLRYTVYDANNQKVKRLIKGDALDIMVNPSYEINDARLLILEPEYRNFPFTVEIEVEISFDGFLGFPVWMPRYAANLEVKNATLVMESYKDFAYRSREMNGLQPPVVSVEKNVKTSVWKIANLPAALGHNTDESFETDQLKLHIAPMKFSLEKTSGNFETWANFGDWFLTLNEGRNLLGADTRDFLNGLQQKYGNDVPAITKTIYQFMQSKTRYISIQLGIGGFQSIPSDKVEKTGYGDCKALTNYMKAMLDHLKIPSHYALVRAGREAPDILYDFPSNQFNHVFLAVPHLRDTLWFECTSQTSPPAFIGSFTDDRHVLWINRGGSKIVRTPAFSAEQNLMKRDCIMDVMQNGDARLDLKVTETGMFFDEAMVFQNYPSERIEQFNYEKFSYKNFSIKGFNYTIPNPNEPVLQLDYQIQISGLGKMLGEKLILPYAMLTSIDHDLDVDILNKKCDVRRASTIEDWIEVRFPENYRLAFEPENISEDTPFGTFKMTIKKGEENTLHVYRHMILQKGTFEGERFDAFYNMVRKVKSLEQNKIVLISKT